MLTQEQYKLFTGQTVSFSSTDWKTIVTVAQLRLASFLCLDTFPTLGDNNIDLAELLANFMANVFKYQGGNDMIDQKSVRNFTIHFKTSSASDAFSQISSQYGDTIDKYSQCGLGVRVERQKGTCCGRFQRFPKCCYI